MTWQVRRKQTAPNDSLKKLFIDSVLSIIQAADLIVLVVCLGLGMWWNTGGVVSGTDVKKRYQQYAAECIYLTCLNPRKVENTIRSLTDKVSLFKSEII